MIQLLASDLSTYIERPSDTKTFYQPMVRHITIAEELRISDYLPLSVLLCFYLHFSIQTNRSDLTYDVL